MPGKSGSRLQAVCLDEAQPPQADLGSRTIPIISPQGWMGRTPEGESNWRFVLTTSRKESGRQSLDRS